MSIGNNAALELPNIKQSERFSLTYRKPTETQYTSLHKSKMTEESSKIDITTPIKSSVHANELYQSDEEIDLEKIDGIAEQFLKKKESMKEIENSSNYNVLSGSKVLTEFIDFTLESLKNVRTIDDHAKYSAGMLILGIEERWLKFLKRFNKQVDTKESEIKKVQTQEMATKREVNSLYVQLEDQIKKSKAKFNLHPIVQKMEFYKKNYEELKDVSSKEIRELSNKVELLKEQNKKYKEQLQQYETDTVISDLRKQLYETENRYRILITQNEEDKKKKESIIIMLSLSKDEADKTLTMRNETIAQNRKEITMLQSKLSDTTKNLLQSSEKNRSQENVMDMMCMTINR